MSAYEREHAHTLNMQQAYLVEDKPMSQGPVNCRVAIIRENKGPVPRSCPRCTLGPCPFFDKDSTSPDGHAAKSRYDKRHEPERMGYTSGPADVVSLPVDSMNARPEPAPINAKSSEAELVDAMSAALLACMSDAGLRFAPADEPPAELVVFERVADAFGEFFNSTGHGVRHRPPGEWTGVFRDARADLRAKLQGIAPAMAECIDWAKADE